MPDIGAVELASKETYRATHLMGSTAYEPGDYAQAACRLEQVLGYLLNGAHFRRKLLFQTCDRLIKAYSELGEAAKIVPLFDRLKHYCQSFALPNRFKLSVLVSAADAAYASGERMESLRMFRYLSNCAGKHTKSFANCCASIFFRMGDIYDVRLLQERGRGWRCKANRHQA